MGLGTERCLRVGRTYNAPAFDLHDNLNTAESCSGRYTEFHAVDRGHFPYRNQGRYVHPLPYITMEAKVKLPWCFPNRRSVRSAASPLFGERWSTSGQSVGANSSASETASSSIQFYVEEFLHLNNIHPHHAFHCYAIGTPRVTNQSADELFAWN